MAVLPLQARTDALTRLPDDRGILFVGGGKKMLGAITATLWVSYAFEMFRHSYNIV